jgi:hypothetical protein
MNFLKGLVTGILSLILFLVLAVFSIAFMLHGTVLSPDFVSSQVDKIEISKIARDIAEDQIGKELPQDATFLNDVAYEVITQQELWIKEQLHKAIDMGYDFFLGKSDKLIITVSLVGLKENLNDSLWQATKDYLKEQLAGKSDTEISRFLQDIIGQIPKDILPSELAVLPGDVSNAAIEQYLREFAGQISIVNLPPIITDQLENVVKGYFDQYLADFIKEVPNTYTIEESSIGSGAMDTFFEVRKGIGYFQTYYYWLIGLMIVLAALIFLVNMNIRVTARSLGINLCLFGSIDLIGVILTMTLSPIKLLANSLDIPASLNSWADGLSKDIASVALPLSIGILVAGVALLVVSFIVKPKEAKD